MLRISVGRYLFVRLFISFLNQLNYKQAKNPIYKKYNKKNKSTIVFVIHRVLLDPTLKQNDKNKSFYDHVSDLNQIPNPNRLKTMMKAKNKRKESAR